MGDRQHYFAKRVRHIARFGRRCKACGRKSAKLPGVGCLECASLLEVKRRWTVFERDLMESHYRREFCWATQRRLYRETGILRSQRAIQKRAVGRSLRGLRPEYAFMAIVTGWRIRNAANAAMTSASEAAENCPPANRPIMSGLRMNTHDP